MSKGILQIGDKQLIDCAWFEALDDVIGIIVYLEGKDNRLKSAIGKGSCSNEAEDAINIMRHGAPFPIKAALQLFGDELNSKVKITSCDYYSCLAEILTNTKKSILHPSWKDFPKLVKEEGYCDSLISEMS